MITKLIAIGSNTFTEVVRQPIYGVLMLVAVLGLVLNVALAGFTLDDDNRLMQDMGLSTLLVTGMFLAGFAATGVLSREIENKTVLTVVSKPVGRPIFIIGKFLGVAGALVLAHYLLSLVFLLTIRHKVMSRLIDEYDMPVLMFGGGAILLSVLVAAWGNFKKGWHFSSSAIWWSLPLMTLAIVGVMMFGPQWQFQKLSLALFDGQLVAAVVLIQMAVLILAAVALAASTRLGQVMTLVICAGTFALGLISSYAIGRFRDESLIADVAYRIVPELNFFWMSDALNLQSSVTVGHVGWVSLYGGVYIVGILAVAVALFQQREVG